MTDALFAKVFSRAMARQMPAPAAPELAGCCQACGKQSLTLLQCARCRTARYCDAECQRSNWLDHKRSCKVAAASGGSTLETPHPPAPRAC